MADIKIVVGADITELNSKLAQAGGVTQAFAAKATSSVSAASVATKGLSSAFSSVSSAIFSVISPANLAFVGIAALGTGLFKLIETVDQMSDAQKRLSSVFDGAQGAYVKAVLQIDKLRDAIQQAKEGVASKEAAVKLYNKVLGEAAGKVETLDQAEKGLTENAEKYIQFTLLKAAANIALQKSAEAAFKAEEERQVGPKPVGFFDPARLAGRGAALAGGVTPEQRQQERINAALKESIKFREIYNKLLAEANALGLKFKETPTPDEEKDTKHLRDINDVLNDLKGNLKFIEQKHILIGTEVSKARIQALTSAMDELLKKFHLATTNPVIVKLAFEINKANQKDFMVGLFAQTGGFGDLQRQETVVKPKIVVKPEIEVVIDKAAQAAIKEFQNTISDLLTGAVSNIFSSLADAVTGKGGIGDIFKNLAHFLGAGVKQLGEHVLQLAILAKLAKLAIKNPYTGIAAGIALIALGTAIEAATSKNAFASGVRNFGGGVALVGERGPELVSLPRGSDVLPNGQLNNMSGASDNWTLNTVIYGQDLRLILQRANATYNRNS